MTNDSVVVELVRAPVAMSGAGCELQSDWCGCDNDCRCDRDCDWDCGGCTSPAY